MLVGYAPFSSETPQNTCRKILNHKKYLQIPEEKQLSVEAVDIISKLITDVENRLGYHGADEIKKHPFFKGIDFEQIRQKHCPPFIPKVTSGDDTRYFERYEEEEPFYPPKENAKKFRKDMDFINFTYKRGMSQEKTGVETTLEALETIKASVEDSARLSNNKSNTNLNNRNIFEKRLKPKEITIEISNKTIAEKKPQEICLSERTDYTTPKQADGFKFPLSIDKENIRKNQENVKKVVSNQKQQAKILLDKETKNKLVFKDAGLNVISPKNNKIAYPEKVLKDCSNVNIPQLITIQPIRKIEINMNDINKKEKNFKSSKSPPKKEQFISKCYVNDFVGSETKTRPVNKYPISKPMSSRNDIKPTSAKINKIPINNVMLTDFKMKHGFKK